MRTRLLNEDQVRAILTDERFIADIAREYGVCQATISHIRTGRIYSDFAPELPRPGRKVLSYTRPKRVETDMTFDALPFYPRRERSMTFDGLTLNQLTEWADERALQRLKRLIDSPDHQIATQAIAMYLDARAKGVL